MNKKKFRLDLFKHIDGIAIIAPIASIFKKNNKILESLKSSKTFTIKKSDLDSYSINGDYLNVTLRLFESQGWIKRKLINKTLEILPTKKGIEIFNNAHLYEKFYSFYSYLSKLTFNNHDSYKELTALLNEYNLIEDKIDNKLILKHIEGLIIGPTLVSLSMDNYIKIDSENKIKINSKISSLNKSFIIKLFKKFQFLIHDKLTDKGLFFYERSAAYGVTVSYMPLFKKMETLLFGNTSNILNRDKKGNELHVNRKMNVWGSGGAHKLYFKKIDEIIIKIFNKPINKQPKGIADMGCGDGTLLIHLYKLIKEKTIRGQNLEKYPLNIIGADFNEEALEVTGKNLNKNNIKHALVKADIGNPENFNKKLIKEYNIKLNDLLSVRSFLDHNRIFKMPNLNNLNLKKITTNSTAAFCCNENNEILEPVIFKYSLIEHFSKWKPHISNFGLIILELHTINPQICKNNIGKTLATAYDATHGYSNQYIIEYEDFIDSAKMSGLKNDKNFEFNFPNNQITTVSINLFSVNH